MLGWVIEAPHCGLRAHCATVPTYDLAAAETLDSTFDVAPFLRLLDIVGPRYRQPIDVNCCIAPSAEVLHLRRTFSTKVTCIFLVAPLAPDHSKCSLTISPFAVRYHRGLSAVFPPPFWSWLDRLRETRGFAIANQREATPEPRVLKRAVVARTRNGWTLTRPCSLHGQLL